GLPLQGPPPAPPWPLLQNQLRLRRAIQLPLRARRGGQSRPDRIGQLQTAPQADRILGGVGSPFSQRKTQNQGLMLGGNVSLSSPQLEQSQIELAELGKVALVNL